MEARSYTDYLELVKYYPEIKTREFVDKIRKRFEYNGGLPAQYTPVIYVLDYTENKYLYVDEACFDLFGYTAKQWKEEGIEGFLSKWHPDDFLIMNARVFPENIKFLENIADTQHEDLIFSFNYRVLNAKGEYITILQRSSFIPGTEKAKPLGSIGVAFEITHFKTDNSVVQTIEESKSIDGKYYNKVLFKKVYFPPTTAPGVISKREMEILRFIAQGFSSKQIADHLFLSINTINNHRKNMLQKTGCKNSSELLNFAMKHRLIEHIS